MDKVTTYFRQVGQELQKVSWPSRQQTIDKTWLVIGVSLVVAVYIGLLDAAFQALVTSLINL
jgi:preprotein translocase subunit SecE